MSLTPQESILTILMNATFLPPKLFSDLRISFGSPVAVTDPTVTDHDTECEIDSKPGFGYYGSAILHYTRVPLSNLNNPSLYSLDDFTPQAVVDQINRNFNSFLQLNDLQSFTVPSIAEDQSEVVTINADPVSLTWKGSVNVTLVKDRPYLSTQVYSGNLANPIHLVDYYGHESGRDKYFHIDFTSLRDALVPTVLNVGTRAQFVGYADYNKIYDTLTGLGYAMFSSPSQLGGVTGDYATSAVPDSNQAFDRVVIQNVYGFRGGSPYVTSPIYLHYNILENR